MFHKKKSTEKVTRNEKCNHLAVRNTTRAFCETLDWKCVTCVRLCVHCIPGEAAPYCVQTAARTARPEYKANKFKATDVYINLISRSNYSKSNHDFILIY